MILHPAKASDDSPQVDVATPSGNVRMTFWMNGAPRPAVQDVTAILQRLVKRSGWRANATSSSRGRRAGGYGYGRSDGACNFYLSVKKTGCTAEEFDKLFGQFTAEVTQVVRDSHRQP